MDFGVAVVDSIYEPGDDFRQYNAVGRTVKPQWLETDQFDQNSEASTTHGFGINHMLTRFTNPVKYHFFQTVGENGEFEDSDMLFALGKILDFSEEIEVVNISAGLDHIADEDKDCTVYGPSCLVCDRVQDLIDTGISVVAGAGNVPGSEGLCCPSLQNDVISVGGMIARCTAEPRKETRGITTPAFMPPNSLGVKKGEDSDSPVAFCSNRGCFPGESCTNNRRCEIWDETPHTETGKPDILAPANYLTEDADGPFMPMGTSYSTPIVTACVSNVLKALYEYGKGPLPGQVRAALERSSNPVEGTEIGVISGEDFADELGDAFGLRYEVQEDSLYDI